MTLTNRDRVDHAVLLEIEEDPAKQGRYDCGNGVREGCSSLFLYRTECTVSAHSTEVCTVKNRCYRPRFGEHCSILEFTPEVVRADIVEIDG